MSNNSHKGRVAILEAVKTPLGFFTLVALILDGLLIATTSQTETISMWAPIGLLAFLIIAVTIIALVRPTGFYKPTRQKIQVNIVFPIRPIRADLHAPISIDLDIDKCTYEIRDVQGRKKPSGRPNITFGTGGWSFQLDKSISESDSVRLHLVGRDGRRWRVNPFDPFVTEQTAIQI